MTTSQPAPAARGGDGDRGGGGGDGGGGGGGDGGDGLAAGHHLGLIGFAHRGAPAWYQRENTVRAFERALAHRATGLESDVWLTADGVAALHHDGIVGAGGRRVPDTDSSRLPHWLPTLAELYEACGTDFDLSLDIKGPPGRTAEAVAAVVDAARKAGGTDAIVRTWLCGNLDDLSRWRRIDADVRLVNSTSLREVRALGGFPDFSARLTDSGVAAVNLRAREWTEQAADEGLPVLRDAGLRAFGWGAQSNRTLRRLVRFGLNGIYSDHLSRLVTVTRA